MPYLYRYFSRSPYRYRYRYFPKSPYRYRYISNLLTDFDIDIFSKTTLPISISIFPISPCRYLYRYRNFQILHIDIAISAGTLCFNNRRLNRKYCKTLPFLGKTSKQKKRFNSGIARIFFFFGVGGGLPLPEFFWHFFWPINSP